jgi:hypothetical protein
MTPKNIPQNLVRLSLFTHKLVIPSLFLPLKSSDVKPEPYCSDMLTFGKPNSSGQWYNNSLSSLIFIFPLNIWRVNQLERSCSLLSEQINTTYSQQFTSDSLTTVLRIFSLPLSSNCRSLNQISLKRARLCDSPWWLWPTTAVWWPPRSCIQDVSFTVRWLCALFSFSHTNAILSWDKMHMSTQNTYLRNRLRGATQLHYIIHIYIDKVNIHLIYNNGHYALCPQRILKPIPFHSPSTVKNYLYNHKTIFTKENIPSLLTTFFLMYIYSSWLNNFW